MNPQKIKLLFRDIIIDFIGGVLLAVGIYNFAVEAMFPMTGVSGISLIFYHLFGTPIGAMTMLFNIPIGIACFRILGKPFFIRSVRSIIITSLVMDILGPLLPLYQGDRLLAALCTGVFSGLGYAIIYMNNSSTGGADFITMSIRAMNPHITLGKIAFVFDTSIVLIGGYVYKDVDGVIYGIIVSFILSSVVDKLMYGIDSGKMTLIVTEHGDLIAEMINQVTGRGATFLQGRGSYTKKEKSVIMCACNNKQMYQIKKLAKKVDPRCFTIIMESNEVLGEGFKLE